MNARQRSLVVPREHGAWGILLVPLVTGGCAGLVAGGRALPLAPLSIGALSLFWLRTPVESWAGAAATRAKSAEEIALVRNVSAALAVAAMAALGWLFLAAGSFTLLWIGAAAGAAFLAQAVVKSRWQAGRTAAQVIGASGLTSLAAAAYLVSMGRMDRAAWVLWMANFLFAFNQIQYVHLRIQARVLGPHEKLSAGSGFFAGQLVLIAILAAAGAVGLLSWWTAAAFLPLLARGFAWFARGPEPLAIHALGKQELCHAIAFAVLLVAGICV
jgi:hypothetical protein